MANGSASSRQAAESQQPSASHVTYTLAHYVAENKKQLVFEIYANKKRVRARAKKVWNRPRNVVRCTRGVLRARTYPCAFSLHRCAFSDAGHFGWCKSSDAGNLPAWMKTRPMKKGAERYISAIRLIVLTPFLLLTHCSSFCSFLSRFLLPHSGHRLRALYVPLPRHRCAPHLCRIIATGAECPDLTQVVLRQFIA
jgi:hypothetical protein